MAFDSFLKLDGVAGESVRSGFEGWIEIYSFSMGASNPSSIGTSGAGAGAGKVSLSGFNYTLPAPADRKSTRLNSSHSSISYAVFCLKKKIRVLSWQRDLMNMRIAMP